MVEPTPNPERQGHLNLGQEIVAGVGGVLFMFVILLFVPYFMVLDRRREASLRSEYRQRGKLVTLDQLQSLSNRGILLVEVRPPGCFGHWWWVDNNELDLTNCPLLIAGPASIHDATKAHFASNEDELWSIRNLSSIAPGASLVDVTPKQWAQQGLATLAEARMINDNLWWQLQHGTPGKRPPRRKARQKQTRI